MQSLLAAQTDAENPKCHSDRPHLDTGCLLRVAGPSWLLGLQTYKSTCFNFKTIKNPFNYTGNHTIDPFILATQVKIGGYIKIVKLEFTAAENQALRKVVEGKV